MNTDLNPSPADSGNEPLRAVVTNYGNLPTSSEGIPDDLKPYVQQVLDMDPIRDVPSSVKDNTGVRPMKFQASALPDEMRHAVLDKLHRLPREMRDGAEERLVREVLTANRAQMRLKTGLSHDALPYHSEQVDIARQAQELARKRDWLAEQVGRVAGFKTVEDPETGDLSSVEIPFLSDPKRAAYREQMVDIDRQIRLLVQSDGSYGIEGQRRMREALLESASRLRKVEAQRLEEAQARQRATEINRERRIQRRAESYARMNPDDLG
jgi:DNA-binding transcriptional ArsR family regulator